MSDFVSLRRPNIPREEQARVLQVLRESDLGKKGYWTEEDVKVAVLSIFGYKPSKYEVAQLIELGLKNNTQSSAVDNSIHTNQSLERFQNLMFAKLALEDSDQECRQMFNAFDTDCKGFLTLRDVTLAFKTVAPNLSESRASICFQNMDKDGDGRISFRDFETCMKFNFI